MFEKLSNLSEVGIFDFSELGVLLLRTCLLARSPPPIVLYSLPPPNFILLLPQQQKLSVRVRVIAYPCSRTTLLAAR